MDISGGGWGVGRRRATVTGHRGEKKERKGVVMKYSGLSDLAALVLYEDAERIETIITKHTNSLSFLLVNWITRCYVT